MKALSRSGIVLPLASLITAFALSAQAQEPNVQVGSPPGATNPPVQAARPVGPRPPGGPAGTRVQGSGGHQRVARGGPPPSRNFAGHAYRGHLAWEGGRWRHEVHDGRDGWWWDVGGVWYWYPERIEGPPAYVSDDYADDVVYVPAAAAYAPPPPGAYLPPPPPPPPPDPGASALGGAIVGGLLGGLLTGRATGAAAGAIVGGATGAIAGATAASRPGYWVTEGNCYYRYPNGQYVQADPRWCY